MNNTEIKKEEQANKKLKLGRGGKIIGWIGLISAGLILYHLYTSPDYHFLTTNQLWGNAAVVLITFFILCCTAYEQNKKNKE